MDGVAVELPVELASSSASSGQARASASSSDVLCDLPCRLALARTLCAALHPMLSPSADAELLLEMHARPLLRARAHTLSADLACGDADPPPLKSTAVENGK